MITENLSTLKIHNLTKEQYERELEAGRIDENALYLTPYEETDLSSYATQEYVDNQINSTLKNVQSDWNAAEGESGHVKNRTHWVGSESLEIVNGNYTTEYFDMYSAFCIDRAFNKSFDKLPDKVTIIYDGTKYSNLTYVYIDGMGYMCGNLYYANSILGTSFENTGEPFIFGFSKHGFTMLTLDTESTEHRVVVNFINDEKIHKLDNKFLDLEWIPAAKIEKGATLLEESEQTFNDSGDPPFVRLDHIFELTAGKTYCLVVDGIEYIRTCVYDETNDILFLGEQNDPYFMLGDDGFYMLHGGEKNQTHTVALYEVVEGVNKLPEKFLPDYLPRIETTIGKKLISTTCQTESLASYGGAFGVNLPFTNTLITIPEKLTIILDGVEYKDLVVITTPLGCITGNLSKVNALQGTSFEDTGEPFMLGIDEYGCLLATDMTQSTIHSVIVKISDVEAIHKLDSKFIDAEWMATVKLKEVANGYTTFASDGGQWSDDESEEKVCMSLSYVEFDAPYEFYVGGIKFTTKCIDVAAIDPELAEMGVVAVFSSDSNDFWAYLLQTGTLLMRSNEEIIGLVNVRVITNTISKLPEEYLPESAALKTDIPAALKNPHTLTINGTEYDGSSAVSVSIEQEQSDWNQNDETQIDYVLNRTHYEIANVIIPERIYTPMDFSDYFIDNNMSVHFEVGKTYIVNFDGVQYECIGKFPKDRYFIADNDPCVYVGNISAYGTNYTDTSDESFCFIIWEGESVPELNILSQYSNDQNIVIGIKEVSVQKLDEKYLPDSVLKKVDRTHYTEESTITILPLADYVNDAGWIESFAYPEENAAFETAKIIPNKTHTVMFKGVRYECTPWVTEDGRLCLGNADIDGYNDSDGNCIDTREPFLWDPDACMMFVTDEESERISIGITVAGEKVSRIDDKYLKCITTESVDNTLEINDITIYPHVHVNRMNLYKVSDEIPYNLNGVAATTTIAEPSALTIRYYDNSKYASNLDIENDWSATCLCIVYDSTISIGGVKLLGSGVYIGVSDALVDQNIGGYQRVVFPNHEFTRPVVKEEYLPTVDHVIIRSSTSGSTKKFKITVDDTGTITVSEVV